MSRMKLQQLNCNPSGKTIIRVGVSISRRPLPVVRAEYLPVFKEKTLQKVMGATVRISRPHLLMVASLVYRLLVLIAPQ